MRGAALSLAMVWAGCDQPPLGEAPPDLAAPEDLTTTTTDLAMPSDLAGLKPPLVKGGFVAFRNLVASDGKVAALLSNDANRVLTVHDATTGALLATLDSHVRNDAGGVFGGGTVVYFDDQKAARFWYPAAQAAVALPAGADPQQVIVSVDGLYLGYGVDAGNGKSDLYVQKRDGAPFKLAAAQTQHRSFAFTTGSDDLYARTDGNPGLTVVPAGAQAAVTVGCQNWDGTTWPCRQFGVAAASVAVIITGAGRIGEGSYKFAPIVADRPQLGLAITNSIEPVQRKGDGHFLFIDDGGFVFEHYMPINLPEDATVVGAGACGNAVKVLDSNTNWVAYAHSLDPMTGVGQICVVNDTGGNGPGDQVVLETTGVWSDASPDGNYLLGVDQSDLDPAKWAIDMVDMKLWAKASPPRVHIGVGVSPWFADASRFVYLRGSDLLLRDAPTGNEAQLATGVTAVRAWASLKRAWWVAADGLYAQSF